MRRHQGRKAAAKGTKEAKKKPEDQAILDLRHELMRQDMAHDRLKVNFGLLITSLRGQAAEMSTELETSLGPPDNFKAGRVEGILFVVREIEDVIRADPYEVLTS